MILSLVVALLGLAPPVGRNQLCQRPNPPPWIGKPVAPWISNPVVPWIGNPALGTGGK